MISIHGHTFGGVSDELTELLRDAPTVTTERWQGVSANQETREIRDVIFSVPLPSEDLQHYRESIKPSVPWADDHFLERICGEPLNPGEQWKNWPWGNSASKFVDKRFNHNYMERLWPKYARRTEDGKLPSSVPGHVRKYPNSDPRPRYGIGHWYGDLEDLVDLLVKEPYTRQAYIPLFFPEDTGVGDGGRKPCTLGYHFMVRNGKVNVVYLLRSCDFVRHWRDDCYLTVRLLLWVLESCRKKSDFWMGIVPGDYTMLMTSLHVFKGDKL